MKDKSIIYEGKRKTVKLGFTKIKTSSKDTVKRLENNFAKHRSDCGLLSKLNKELWKLNSKNIDDPFS